MTSVADAYVDLHVNGDGLEGEVRSSVRRAGPDGERESDRVGNRMGARMAAGFIKGFGKIKAGAGKMGKEVAEAFSGLSKLKIPALAALIPLATSGLSALSGALVAFTGAVVQAGGASLSFVGVLGSLVQAKIVAGIAFKDFTKAVGGDEEAMKALSPAARAAAKAAEGLTKSWGGVKKAIQQEVFKGLDDTITRVGKITLPVLQKGLTGTGTVLNGLFQNLGRFVTSEGFVKKFGLALKNNNGIFATLSKAAVPVLKGILNVFLALQPSAGRLSEKILGVARAFRDWSSAAGTADGIREFMRKAFKAAGSLLAILGNLGSTLRNVFGAATPAGRGLLKTFADLTGRLAAFTELATTKNAIAEWAQKGIDISGKLFSGLGAGAGLLTAIFNPAIFGAFLTMIEKLTPSIKGVFDVIASAVQPIIDAMGPAFAELGPKFAKLFTALAPLLKGVGAVLGNLVSQMAGTIGLVLDLITPVVAAISKVLGPLIEKFAPVIAFLIFGFSNMGSKLLGLIPILGKVLGPMGKLAEIMFSGVVKTLGLVSKALKPFATVFANVFTSIAGYFKPVVTAAKWLWDVLFGHSIFPDILAGMQIFVNVFKGYISIWVNVFKFGFNLMKTIATAVWNGIKAVFNAGAAVITRVVSGLSRIVGIARSIFSNVWSTVSSVVSGGIARVMSLFSTIAGKISGFGGAILGAAKGVGGKIISGIMEGIKGAGGFIGDLMSSIKSAINGALNLPFTIKGPGPLPDFTIPAFARGTRSAPGGLALAGEKGPELVNIPRGSRVHTASETKGMLGKAGPTYQIENLTVQNAVPKPASDLPRTLSTLNYLLAG